ncbi:hypothetical protein BGZ73_004851 [Actinomortierella ambigua]|nr:hypothetical protein BGZ73_004851 [Actinomortierella ambigua]
MFEKLVSFAVVANVPKMADVLQGLSNVTTNLDTLSNCKDCKKQDEVARFQSKATNSPSPLDQTRCYAAADVYRAAVDDAIRRFPVTKDDSNDASGSAQNQEPKMRLVEGTRSVLDLMSKYTIPPENENLSKSRAVLYVGDLLEQYRSQLEPLAITEEEKLFMRVSLPALVGTSNALEACLYIAANPEVVGQDVEKELEEDEDNE